MQLATASLHPELARVEYLSGNPALAALGIDSRQIVVLLARAESVRSVRLRELRIDRQRPVDRGFRPGPVLVLLVAIEG